MLPISILTASTMPDAPSGRQQEDTQALAVALGLHSETPISILRGSWRDAPPDRFLIVPYEDIELSLADCAPEQRSNLAARTIVLGAVWPNAVRSLDEYRTAGAIDLRRYWMWRDHPESDSGNGIFGLISVAERAGMRWESARRYGSEQYGLLGCPEHCRDLPSLLVHYLTVYEELGLHLRRPDVASGPR